MASFGLLFVTFNNDAWSNKYQANENVYQSDQDDPDNWRYG